MRLSRAIVGVCLIGVVATAAGSAVGTEKPSAEVKPPWQRYLQGKDAQKAGELESQMWKLLEAGQFDEALKVAEALVELRQKVQGADHWQAEKARQAREAIRRVLRHGKEARKEYGGVLALIRQAEAMEKKVQYKEAQPLREKILATCCKVLGEKHADTATSYNNVAYNLKSQGKYREAEEGYRKALAIYRKVLGEEHPDTATGYNNVAANLDAQGKYREAEEGYRKALVIRRKVLGEEHPATAGSYNNVAFNQNDQGKYRQAEEGLRKALAIYRKVLGEEHPSTATSYNNVAANLDDQGKYREAEEGYRKALAIRRKVLGEEHLDTAASYNNVAYNLKSQGKYREAEEGYRKALAIKRKVLGEEHPATATSYNNLAANQNAQGKYGEAEEGYRKALAIRRKVLGEEHPVTALSYNNVAGNLQSQGKYWEADEGFREALVIRRKVLGEEHPDTAQSYDNVAFNQNDQGKYREAEEGFRKALAIRRKVLGEEHPDTATSYNNMATNQNAQGKYRDAEEGFGKALAIRRKLLGEEHPATATSYNNVAGNLQSQGKYGEAEEGYRKALAISRKVLGEEHPATATSYNNVASNQNAQGKYREAEEGFRKALVIRRKLLGEEHPDTAGSYHNVANNLNAQGKYREAVEGYRKALAIKRKVLGEEHPDTATSYNNLAVNLNAQGKYAEAEQGYRKALAIRRKVLGEEHPDTAESYNSVGANLDEQGKYKEAEEYARKSLAICRKALGEEHLYTALSYYNLASTLNTQSKYAEAEDSWRDAARIFAKARPRLAASGLDRAAKTSERSPLPHLAGVLARNGKPEEAWQRFEESLARGTWDDMTARLHRTPAELTQQAQLIARLDRLDRLIEKALAIKEPAREQDQRRKDLLSQQRHAQEQWSEFDRLMKNTHGSAAGQVFPRKDIQAALPKDAALIAWLDLPGAAKAKDPNGEHWAILLRSAGPPLWVQLRGSGTEDAWTDDDTRLLGQLRAALQSPVGKWQPLAQRLRKQRLDPLRKHLDSVKHLIVLPSTALAGVPVEVFAGVYTVSYALSGTMYAYLRGQPKPTSTGLLALADPVFDAPADAPREEPLPPGGILLTMVAPKSNAARAGLRPNDVLLRYRDSELSSLTDLHTQTKDNGSDKPVSVLVWRGGKTFERTLQPGRLGVVVANDPAPKALTEQRNFDRKLATRTRGGEWQPLPGTRVEIEGLRRLFAEPVPTLLVDSQASEQRLYDLAQKGDLGKYRYLHLATHGEVDDCFPLQSSVILARDDLPDPLKQLQDGKPVFDGRLTAEEVLRSWHLHCELVTLSACQTALGRHEGGEGFVGFAQTLILSGSRSVCLSLWKVDDSATALLMERFYQNLLGKREGLKEPLAKSAALAEAKAWLRDLPREEAVKRVASLSDGVARGKGRPVLPLLPAVPPTPTKVKEDRPYEHPYYWAAFVLIGDRE